MSTEVENNLRQTCESWLSEWMVKEFSIAPSEVDPARAFLSYGMDSVQAMMLVGDLEARFGLRLRPTLVWDHPNLESLVRFLLECLRDKPSSGPHAASNGQPVLAPHAAAAFASTNGEPQAVLDQLENLSEAELDSLLAKFVQQPR